MNDNELPYQDVVQRHLTFPLPVQGVQLFSGLLAGLRDARQATGRNIETGEKITGEPHNRWLGAIGYLILLDQVGKCFKPKGKELCRGKALEQALNHFENPPPDAVYAIYALRCALLHEYGLSNVPEREKDKAKYQHSFVLLCHPDAPLVIMPANRWDGKYETISPDNQTGVNVEALGDLVEGIFLKMSALHAANELEIILPGGEEELRRRYGYWCFASSPAS